MKRAYQQHEVFAQITSALIEFAETGNAFGARKALRKDFGLSYNTAMLRWKQALEAQKWLNEECLVITRY